MASADVLCFELRAVKFEVEPAGFFSQLVKRSVA